MVLIWNGYPKRYAKNAIIPPKNTNQAMNPIIPNAPVSRDATAMNAEASQTTEGKDRLIHASVIVGDNPDTI